MAITEVEGAVNAALSNFSFPVKRPVSDEKMRENMLYALSLGLKPIRKCHAHDLILTVAGGGPSLADTYAKMRKTGTRSRVVAVNGSHDFLIERGIVPYGCGLMDANPILAERITPNRNVMYFVASTCDRAVFDKLKGYNVVLWHPSGQFSDEQDVLNKHSLEWMMTGGGSTVSLRWLSLGYSLGFREFRLHGFDSCFRAGKAHAYAQDDGPRPEPILWRGYLTLPTWLLQVSDFFAMLDRLTKPDMEPIKIKMFGDGLLQSQFKQFRKECGNLFT